MVRDLLRAFVRGELGQRGEGKGECVSCLLMPPVAATDGCRHVVDGSADRNLACRPEYDSIAGSEGWTRVFVLQGGASAASRIIFSTKKRHETGRPFMHRRAPHDS